ncbi:pyridoxal-phosphate dependent enzyme [Thiomicrorhabdus sp. ZW0627]|uniref:1-aminocyclopropane-1-carboxylate deaminase/D-cysteine desulfhydrase n=1 Tax=Thiomicrorhabdus sp. ZW0627 TaxID=3039774 RepID=UPI002436A8D0|nr:pyridoxal-phosphate dependent enzyme [Thiomicrorhabdus sp. ZW0627]MDG6773164.1 pyridoxal-phosphate dependent enzyme [Thiomicrorhabdus sp. ZW0627]
MQTRFSKNPTPLQPISDPLFEKKRIQVWIKREDLNHPDIQGNKWHKLRHNLAAALEKGQTELLTFGGAYSNHIAATAFAAKEYGLKSIGLIRGDELADNPQRWSHTLKLASENGMQLIFLNRQEYRKRNDASFLQTLQERYPNAFILPEGGSNALAVLGFESLMQNLQEQCPQWTHLYTAVGTGGTLAGLVKYASPYSGRKILGVATLKEADYLLPQISQWIGKTEVVDWELLTQYHDGGYGKLSENLRLFKSRFETDYDVPLDPVYTVKAFHAFYQQLQQGEIPPGSNVVLLHTGGLQGNSV